VAVLDWKKECFWQKILASNTSASQTHPGL
jgi:hypothetical protein